MQDSIQVRGARQHNLRDIDVSVPHRSLTVVTGLSGSGKSSLAFDTIYAEGQRRYVETLSPYARQYLEQLERPDIDSIDGLSPSLSIEQKTASRSPRSTVGTVTEVYDYLRVLYSSVGTPYCVRCNLPIQRQSSEILSERIFEENLGEHVTVLAPCVRGRKGHYRRQLGEWARAGFISARIDGTMQRLDDNPLAFDLNRNQNHTIEVVVDKVAVRQGAKERLRNSIQTASKLAGGLVLIIRQNHHEALYSEKLACVECGASVPEFEPRSFSFNSRFGGCPKCRGLGMSWDLDPERLIVNPSRPLELSGIPRGRAYRWALRHVFDAAKKARIDIKRPWASLSKAQREYLLYATRRGKPVNVHSLTGMNMGLIPLLRASLGVGAGYEPTRQTSRFMFKTVCPACGGDRLNPDALAVRVADHSISDMAGMQLEHLRLLLNDLRLDARKQLVAQRLLDEIRHRVDFLCNVGLGYLSLGRGAATLSGGEAQRVRLATQIGTRLRGVLYVLDEPSIGLHARDHGMLLDSLVELKDLGNTVIVVEHDQATIERADHVIDLGPGAGRLGGHLIASGPPESIAAVPESLTGDYLQGRKNAVVRATKQRPRKAKLTVVGARQHNLRNIEVAFPLGNLCVVTGVSGSGKSTLVNGILYPALARWFHSSNQRPGDHDRIDGLQWIDKVVRIDQRPIGRTPRSNPATYTGTFTPIRQFFALLPESRARGYGPGRFSFNVAGGRCEACGGNGLKRVEMRFLPDVFVKCDACQGRRYNRETLEVRYKDHSIADLLESNVDQVLELMGDLPAVRSRLATLSAVGLGYIHLGQSSTTISGGEAQRMKLARELSKKQTGKTIFILDEPTTGLHFHDVRKLLEVLRALVDLGNTVVVIEHQLDVIRSADWIVDLGPGGGDSGGEIVCEGSPDIVAASATSHTGAALRAVGVQ